MNSKVLCYFIPSIPPPTSNVPFDPHQLARRGISFLLNQQLCANRSFLQLALAKYFSTFIKTTVSTIIMYTRGAQAWEGMPAS